MMSAQASRWDVQAWARALHADLAALPYAQRRGFIEGKVACRGVSEQESAVEQLRVLSLPERVPGQHELARRRLHASADILGRSIAELTALAESPDEDVRVAAALRLPTLVEFAGVTIQAALTNGPGPMISAAILANKPQAQDGQDSQDAPPSTREAG